VGDHGCLAGRLSPPVAGPCLADEPTERDDRVGEVEERAALVAPGNLLPFAREPDARLCRARAHTVLRTRGKRDFRGPLQRILVRNGPHWMVSEDLSRRKTRSSVVPGGSGEKL